MSTCGAGFARPGVLTALMGGSGAGKVRLVLLSTHLGPAWIPALPQLP
jgi:hypothetical protein